MQIWHYDTARDVEQPLIERLRGFPREPDMFVYGLRSLAALLLRAWLRLYHRLEIIGRENLPAEGSFVLVANHSSHLDVICLLAALPLRKLHRAFPAAAADYFFESPPRIWAAAILVNALPFSREAHIRQSLHLCQKLLETPGNVLIVFPEGTRSPTGQIGDFKPGIGALLAGRDIPVLPCHIAGTFKAWPKSRVMPRPSPVRLMIGPCRKYAAFAPGKESACAIAAELQKAVQELGARDTQAL